jgi:protein required for attachment to host cells
MLLSHGLLVLVVDGSSMKLLHNRGNELRPELELVEQAHLDNPAAQEVAASRPGRSFENANTAKHAYAVDDLHDRRKVQFGGEALQRLQCHLLPHMRAVVIAPRAMLGELRKIMKPDLERHIVAQFDKDLTHCDATGIAEFLSDPQSSISGRRWHFGPPFSGGVGTVTDSTQRAAHDRRD